MHRNLRKARERGLKTPTLSAGLQGNRMAGAGSAEGAPEGIGLGLSGTRPRPLPKHR